MVKTSVSQSRTDLRLGRCAITVSHTVTILWNSTLSILIDISASSSEDCEHVREIELGVRIL